MKKLEQIIGRACELQKSDAKTSPLLDQRILEAAAQHLPQATPPAKSIWSIIMKNRMTHIAAVILVVAGIFSLTLFEGPVQEAYGIEQTIAAMDTIRTVYFKAEFFKQGPVECWMRFDGKDRKPTHLCLFMTGFPIRKIDSPEGTFAYNSRTNRYMQTQRDERQKNWYIDFANFFRQSLEKAKSDAKTQITRRVDPGTEKEMIVIHVMEDNRTVEYLIDPQTKLPVQFTTLELSNFMYFFRQTIAVRNMTEIRYNQPIPEGIFTIPADAQLVTNEHDIIISPDAGMPADGLTNEEACEKIVRHVAEAMNARDWRWVSKLMFPFGQPPKEMLAKIPTDTNKPLVEILETGKPYEKDGYWYIPSKSRETGGKLKDEQVPVKFYEFDGKRYCMIMWPD
jgi:hypothetical protein